MPPRLWVRAPTMLLWAIVVLFSPPTIAHDTQRNLYVDPTAYADSQRSLRHHIPLGQARDASELSDDLAIQIKGGEQKAIELGRSYGLEYLDQVFDNPAVFHFRRLRQNRSKRGRSRRETTARELVEAIARDPGVEWVEQQVAFVREKRNSFVKSGKQRATFRENSDIHHRKLPNIRSASRRALKQALRRPPNASSQSQQSLSLEYSRTIDGYFKDDSEIDRATEFEHGQYDENHPFPLKDAFIRVPLSRSLGYGIELARAGVCKQCHGGEDDTRPTIPDEQRPRTLRNNIKMAEVGKITRTEADGKGVSFRPPDESFGLWLDHLGEPFMDFNDPFYNDQWYLRNTGQLGRQGYDLNVTWAWLNGYTGRGVVLSVLDDGLQMTNADIAQNYAPNISYSLVKDRNSWNDPSPRIDSAFSNSHGTYCAGIISAVSNNSICGVGVAYNSRVGAVRLVDGKVTDVQEATALSRHVDQVDVFSASWGPTDDGTKLEGPARLTQIAFVEGVTKGRGGKGAIYVWASGNGGVVGDNCNLDGYTSSIYTLSVSALTDMGTSTFYEEPCASTLAGVYVGGEHTLEVAKERQRKHLESLNVVVPELDGHCSHDFQGTSAAAPLMAGVVALVISANGNLTWRDVQHIVVETSTPTPQALQEPGWQTNGLGRKFHLKQGFGAVNAGRMVEAALHWRNVRPQKVIVIPLFSGHRIFHPSGWMNLSHPVDSSAVPPTQRMTAVEHAIANVTLIHPKRKLLTIFIVSPAGTTSQVLTHRPPDEDKDGFRSWGFMSVHFWGESPEGGEWKVALKDDSGETGYLKKVQLTIFGS